VVRGCKKRTTKEEFAVKVLDVRETPVEAIQSEADMLASLDHPNIVKLHGVFFEGRYVCIVMDKYCGGDLVTALRTHLDERCLFNCRSVVHVAQQIGCSIQYLHARNIVHRDVKGDNCLLDRPDVTEPGCKVVLTDFGTACGIYPSERLSRPAGTMHYWAPELYDRDYGAKVDVWRWALLCTAWSRAASLSPTRMLSGKRESTYLKKSNVIQCARISSRKC